MPDLRKTKILFLGSSPAGMEPLSVAPEYQAIKDQLRDTKHGDRFDLEPEFVVRAHRLPGLIMRERPHVLHFSGHGSPDGLFFHGADGNAKLADRKVIARIFGVLKGRVRCIVLNACYSAEQAKLIAEHVDVVVGMSDEILDEAAIAFAVGFYEALGYGESVKMALELGAAQSDLTGPGHTGALVLETRLGIDPATVFLHQNELDPSAEVLFEGSTPGLPARLMPHFKGRDDELDQLEQFLRADNRTVCVVATGIGGIGKTTLAEEFVATRASELFPDGAMWLDGGQLVAELGRVSRRFGWTNERAPTPAEAISLLGTTYHSKRVLLVVDNFDPEHGDPEHVPAPGGQCRTLVTSRARAVHVLLDAVTLELGIWAIKACREYLRERCPRLRGVVDAELDALVVFVGRLPLGVRLLVSVLSRRRSLSPTALLELLEAQPLSVLDKYDADRGIAATFQFSYHDLGGEERRVLQALAVCARQTRAEVVEAVAGVGDVGELLDNLHARGLAEFAAEAGTPWGLHDVVRMFVHEQPGREKFETAHTGWVRAHMERHSAETARREFDTGVAEARRAFGRLVGNNLEEAVPIYGFLETHLSVMGNSPEAIEISESLLKASPADSKHIALARNRLGNRYEVLGDISKAIDSHKRSLTIEEKLGRLDGQANSLGNLGICFRMLGDIPKAIEFLRRSLAIQERRGDLEGQAAAFSNLGNCYGTLGDIPKAIDLHKRSLAIYENSHRLQGQAVALGNLGSNYRMLGDIQTAIGFHQRSLAMEEKLGHIEGQAAQLGKLGHCHRTLGDIPKAIELIQRSLAIDEQIGRLLGQAAQLDNLGLCYWTLGDIRKAIDFHERSLAISEQLSNPQGQGATLGNLGNCYRTLGDIQTAIDFYRRALAIEETIGHLEGQANNLGSLGVCELALGDIPKAIDSHQRALAIDERLGRLEGQAAQLGNLGNCYRTLGDIPKAIDFHQRALAIDEQIGYLAGRAIQLGGLGNCYQTLRDFPKAIDLHERSLAIHEKLGSPSGQAGANANLGFIFAQHGAPDQARGYLTRALELFRCMSLPDDHHDVAIVSRALVELASHGLGLRGPAPGAVQHSGQVSELADLGDVAQFKKGSKKSGRRKRPKKA